MNRSCLTYQVTKSANNEKTAENKATSVQRPLKLIQRVGDALMSARRPPRFANLRGANSCHASQELGRRVPGKLSQIPMDLRTVRRMSGASGNSVRTFSRKLGLIMGLPCGAEIGLSSVSLRFLF